MKIYMLSSGSMGNATLISCNDTNILIDLGVSKSYLINVLNKINLNFSDINFVLLTHDHADHVSGLKCIKDIPIYGGENSYKSLNYKIIKPYETYKISNIEIMPIQLSHDAKNPLGFIIKSNNEKLVYITDTGYISDKNLKLSNNADYYIIESNHDENMLQESDRYYLLKNRIMSEFGHISNNDCALYLSTLIGSNTKEIFLAHISIECNTYDLAYNTVKNYLSNKGFDLNKIKIFVARQKEMVNDIYEN